MELAPVGIYTYTRIDHLRKTIEALKHNSIAKETTLFTFSDGPGPGDEKGVRFLESLKRDEREQTPAFDKIKEVLNLIDAISKASGSINYLPPWRLAFKALFLRFLTSRSIR